MTSRGTDPDQLTRHSTSGFATAQAYSSQVFVPDGLQESTDFPPPGQFPFTRGFNELGYREHPWEIEMYAGFGSPEEANRRYRFLLENGATGGVSIALDLPTQIGYDSDAPLSEGEVGRTGVALDCFSDFEVLFEGVDLPTVGHVFTTANCIAPVFYAWMWTFCHRHQVDAKAFRLQIQNDPIKEYVARGTYFLPPDAAVRLATDVVVHSHVATPRWLPMSVSGSHMKQAGASPAQEAAFTIANAIAYMEDVERKGVPLRDFNPTLELHFCTDMDFFEEIAKYRAVRRAWSEIARDRFGVGPDKLAFRLHAATSGLPLTAQQPMNNIARITLQALAQILGGVEATRTASWDEALAIPTQDSAKLSVRINQIIADETGIPDTTDPLGGSYYVEHLTSQIHRVVVEEVRKIDAIGGALAAVANGYYAEALGRGAYEAQRALDDGRRIVVGVNRHVEEEGVSYPRFRIDEDGELRQCARLRAMRAARDQGAVRRALEELETICRGTTNVMPAVIAAVEADATIGEICDTWRAVFGEYQAGRVNIG